MLDESLTAALALPVDRDDQLSARFVSSVHYGELGKAVERADSTGVFRMALGSAQSGKVGHRMRKSQSSKLGTSHHAD